MRTQHLTSSGVQEPSQNILQTFGVQEKESFTSIAKNLSMEPGNTFLLLLITLLPNSLLRIFTLHPNLFPGRHFT